MIFSLNKEGANQILLPGNDHIFPGLCLRGELHQANLNRNTVKISTQRQREREFERFGVVLVGSSIYFWLNASTA